MTAPGCFDRVAVLGLGLLGGSLALAAKRRGVARTVVGSARRRGPLQAALRDGIIDEIADSREAVRGADLVVLATPVGTMASLVQEVAPELAPDALVTDVGSVKAILTDTLPGLLPPGVTFVGGHPMAGSHSQGVEHADPDLFEGACCVLTPLADTPPDAVERLRRFWQALGARVVMRDPAVHDDQVAWTSHTPHVLAFGFAAALARAPERSGELTGGGFRDFTRIAESDPELWSDILTANRKALGAPLAAVGEVLRELGQAIEANDPDGVERWISGARDALALVMRSAPAATSMDEGHASNQTTNPRPKTDPRSG